VGTVILGEASLYCEIRFIQRSFVAFGSSEDSLASFLQAVGGLKGFETASSAFLPPTVAARTMLSVQCSYS